MLLNTLNFVFSIIALCLHYAKTSLCFLLNNVRPPKKSTFYKEQNKVVNCLCQMASNSMNKYANKTHKNDVVSVDGAWDHRVNGGECQAVFINQRIDKVIGVSLITKGSGKMVGNFDGCSQNMECEAIKRALPKIKELNFSGYVHDQKKDVTNIFKNNWSALEEHLDANHVKKSLERRIKKYNLISDLKDKLIRWFYCIAKKNVKPERKQALWLNSEQHYSGDHSKCGKHGQVTNEWKLKNDKNAKEQLHKFLKETSETVMKVGNKYSTNTNESFNSLHTQFADKATSWKTSYRGRLAASILQKNEPYVWILDARKRLNLPELDDEIKKDINHLFHTQIQRRTTQKSPVYKMQRKKNKSTKY